MKLLSFLLFLLIFVTSSNGQNKVQPRKIIKAPKKIIDGHPKMVRTQGAGYTQIDCGFQDKTGNLWFGTLNEGVYRYDGTTFTNFTKKDGLSSNEVSAIIQDRAGNILFATDRGVCKYDGRSFANFTENNDVNNSSIASLLEDREGNLWLGTMGSGVYRYDGKTFTNFLNNEYLNNQRIRPQFILSIVQDKTGNIWFC